jgi:hypothetical protein
MSNQDYASRDGRCGLNFLNGGGGAEPEHGGGHCCSHELPGIGLRVEAAHEKMMFL